MFTAETDRLIRDVATMSDRFDLNPFMFGDPPSARADRWRTPKLWDAVVAPS